MFGGNLAEVWLRRHEPRGVVPDLRAHIRQIFGRARTDVERGAFAWFGMAELPARVVRDLVARKYRVDGRCRRYRTLFGRLGHQACHGECDLDGGLSRQRTVLARSICKI